MKVSAQVTAVLIVLATIAIFLAPLPDNVTNLQFENYKSLYGKHYSTEEEAYRFNIFEQNLKEIQSHNADESQTYKKGLNQFSDLPKKEFKEKILMNDLMSKQFLKPIKTISGLSPIDDAVDWRDKGVLTPIKNQGNCGSCWAFSTTGVLESTLAISTKTLLSFSEQQLVDCCGVKGYQCQGCSGAWPQWAFNYIKSAGIVLETEYTYTARQGTCQSVPTAKKYLNNDKPWTMISDLSSIKNSLSQGPISICVDASNWSSYRSGVLTSCGTQLNHAVLLVGYNEDGSWIVKNSWGASWGESGFIRLGTGNTCGLGNHALIPVLA